MKYIYLIRLMTQNSKEKNNLYNAYDNCCFKSFEFDLTSLRDAVNGAIERIRGEQNSVHFQTKEFQNKDHTINDEMVTFIVAQADGSASK